MLNQRIEQSGAKLTFGALPTVHGDTRQMAHVFQNLLSNALKYRSRERTPEIKITFQPNGHQWVFSVSDNGIGFDPRFAVRLFGLFKRLHNDEYEGTGLGLAICKRIVEKYGGRRDGWAKVPTFYLSLEAADKGGSR